MNTLVDVCNEFLHGISKERRERLELDHHFMQAASRAREEKRKAEKARNEQSNEDSQ